MMIQRMIPSPGFMAAAWSTFRATFGRQSTSGTCAARGPRRRLPFNQDEGLRAGDSHHHFAVGIRRPDGEAVSGGLGADRG